MKIALTVGHSRLINGSYTSADGREYGGCIEYKWCKNFSKQLAAQLKKNGHSVDTIICPEKKFTSSKQEKPHKLEIINSGNYDLVVELHLNAASPSANGCEVLYISDKGKRYASAIQNQLAGIFRDRGIVKRNDLYMLNKTTPPAILIETFFCTNKNDYKKAKGLTKRRKIAKLIAAGIQKAK
ncbi:MAG: N-acetylmuramoyl-L-alanine amidase [Lachnospiraceae bacterium]|nr:N-acetylmuramoyl-L-alanine amidase [Lachnospiraceae bacterium]